MISGEITVNKQHVQFVLSYFFSRLNIIFFRRQMEMTNIKNMSI